MQVTSRLDKLETHTCPNTVDLRGETQDRRKSGEIRNLISGLPSDMYSHAMRSAGTNRQHGRTILKHWDSQRMGQMCREKRTCTMTLIWTT